MGGFAQEKNAATVLCAVEQLQAKLTIPPKAIYKGFRFVVENTGLLGRWQIIRYNPKVILDTGHNVAGINYIVQQLERERYDRLHILFGMVNDKDCSSVLKLLPQEAAYYFTQASIPRALPASQLKEEAQKSGLQGEDYPSVSEAFQSAMSLASEKDLIFVGGSTFVVADALSYLETINTKY